MANPCGSGTNPCGAGHSGAKMAAAGALASLLPPLFLEARVHAGGGGGTNFGDLVTQLGLSMPAAKNVDVAIFGEFLYIFCKKLIEKFASKVYLITHCFQCVLILIFGTSSKNS
jgi:hypothetical protein